MFVLCFFLLMLFLLILFDNVTSWVGWVVSTLLAGATVGSFTGGALADKFGRRRTFQLDAIPLAVGAFLWSVFCHWRQGCDIWYIYWILMLCLKYFQCHCPERTNYDNWPLTCWHWNWCHICYCATLHIWGSILLYIIGTVTMCVFILYKFLVWFFQQSFKLQISPTEIRGALGSVNQLFICIGILAALVAGLPLAGNPIWYSFYWIFFLCPYQLFTSCYLWITRRTHTTIWLKLLNSTYDIIKKYL